MPLKAERRAVKPSRPEDGMAARITTYVVVGIVAATLIAGLIVGAQRDDNDGPVDLIVFNGAVYTADGSGTMAEAVAIRGNQILRVGTSREINRLRRPQTTVVDALGAAVLPGFNDAHVQFIAGGLTLGTVDLLDADTPDEIQARIRLWAAANPDKPWLVGRGWDAETFGAAGPTRHLLDLEVPDRPALVLSSDGRSAWANSRALRLAGITRRTTTPATGVIVKEPRTGEPTGWLKDGAVELVLRLVPKPSREDKARALHEAIIEAQRNGVTSVHDVTTGPEEFALYEDARRARELTVRVYSSVRVDAAPDAAAPDPFPGLEALSSKYPDDPVFKVGGATIAIDGPVESGRAAVLEPYEGKGPPFTGDALIGPDALNRVVRMLDARGWQVTAEASGDRAVRMALDAFEHARRSNGHVERIRRHRIDHIEIVDPADLPRFGSLGLVGSMEPLQGSSLDRGIATWVRSVGPERTARAWPYRSVGAAAVKFAWGTGWPVAPLSPMGAIHTAVNGPDGTSESDRTIPLKRAIDAFTSGPAYASFDEQRKGAIKAGMLADLVVLSNDIFKAPPSELRAATVAVTVFDGKIVYRRSTKSTD
jgi:predicted amidohydrolase YtcJ